MFSRQIIKPLALGSAILAAIIGGAMAGATGTAEQPRTASEEAGFPNQLKQTDGYTEPTAAPAPRAGAAGRAGKLESPGAGSERSPKRRLILDLRR